MLHPWFKRTNLRVYPRPPMLWPPVNVWRQCLVYNNESGALRCVKTGARLDRGSREGYRHVHINGYRYQAHTIIWALLTGAYPEQGKRVEHKNLNKSDNRSENLRTATTSQNNYNRPKAKNNKSGFKGVTKIHNHKWSARLGFEGQQLRLGYWPSAEKAFEIRKKVVEALHEEFARHD